MKRKLIAFLVALCLLLTGLPGTPVKATAAEAEKESVSAEASALAALPAYQPEGDCKILNYVHADVFVQGDHVARLHEEESLSSYAFLNRDGTKTVYYLDEVVKFEAADGRILEKDLTLRSEKGGYATTQNDVSLHLPASPASGVRLSYNNKQVTLIPQGGTGTAASDGKAVRYDDYYGPGMDLVYTPTMDGVKEEIILSAYSGINSFTFLLNTGRLNLYQSGNRHFLAESKLSDSKIWLGALEIFDAAIQPGPGNVTMETVKAGQQYRITLTVDEDYLTDPNTVYPVTIDPTLTVSDNTHGAGAIEDAPIYEGYPTSNFGSYQYNRAGYAGTTYKKGRTVVRLKGMLNDAEFSRVYDFNIHTARFYVADATGGTSSASVKLHPMTENLIWTESNITWYTLGNYSPYAAASAALSGGVYAMFDITELVKKWKQGQYSSGNCGFVMVGASEASVDRSMYSSEHTTASKRPYVVLTYEKADTITFQHYYDETILGNTAVISYIQDATAFVNTVFSDLYGVQFVNAFAPAYKSETLASQCGMNDNHLCKDAICGSPCGEHHHKNSARILEEIESWSRPDNCITVLWSDRPKEAYCKADDELGHNADTFLANTKPSTPAIHMKTIIDGTPEQVRAYMSVILLHEVMHVFGHQEMYDGVWMKDIYFDGPEADIVFIVHEVESAMVCVMERYNLSNKNEAVALYNAAMQNGEEALCAYCEYLAEGMGIYAVGNQ